MSAQKNIFRGFTLIRTLLRKNLIRSQQGFTLIELLITIAIIGVLSAAVLIGLNPAQKLKQAGDAKVKSDVGQTVSALTSYYTTHQYFPLSGIANMNTALTGAGDLGASLNTTTYAYTAYKASGGTAACDNLAAATYCGAASFSGALAATGTYWCYKTATSTITEVTSAAACAP